MNTVPLRSSSDPSAGRSTTTVPKSKLTPADADHLLSLMQECRQAARAAAIAGMQPSAVGASLPEQDRDTEAYHRLVAAVRALVPGGAR